MGRQLKKKKIITAIAGLCLIFVYGMIFLFSSDNAEESSVISVKITDFLIQVYYKFAGGGGELAAVNPAYMFPIEEIIRKLAHFMEYMLVGFLSYGIAVMWIEKQRTGFWLVLLQLVVSGTLDELHQYFVPGRYASFTDVLIDTAGGVAGILILYLIRKVNNHAAG